MKSCTQYNANGGKGIVTQIKLENGDLASEDQFRKEIENKYISLFNCENAENSKWTETEFNKWDYWVTSKTKNKALSVDLIPDQILIDTGNEFFDSNRINMIVERVRNINEKAIFLKHMCGRLVLINKIHPRTPTINDIRPITVLSPIRKFLELQINYKIKSYCRYQINKAQTGFVENLGTDINLLRISEYLSQYK